MNIENKLELYDKRTEALVRMYLRFSRKDTVELDEFFRFRSLAVAEITGNTEGLENAGKENREEHVAVPKPETAGEPQPRPMPAKTKLEKEAGKKAEKEADGNTVENKTKTANPPDELFKMLEDMREMNG